MKVLIVDDHSVVLEGLVMILDTMDCGEFEPIPVTSAALALNMVAKGDIFLVLTDCNMPDMNGLGLIQKIKEINPLTECIMMTASSDQDTVLKALRAGARDFIKKPFNIEDIEEAFRQAYARLKLIPTLEQVRSIQIARAVNVCNTDKEAAEKLGINYTTLHRNRKKLPI